MENNSTSLPSPPSPTPSRPSGFNLWASLAFLLGAVAVALGALFAFLIYAVFTGEIDVHQRRIGPMAEMVGTIVMYVPLGAYLVFGLPLLARRTLRELGMRAPGWREVGIGLFGALLMTLAVNLTGAAIIAITHRHDTEAAIALLAQLKTPREQATFIAIAALFAPLVEELGFRVFLFNAFARYAPVWLAAVLSGAIFGLAHFGLTPWQLLTVGVPLSCGGIVLALVYRWSRCYWSNVITHSVFNALPLTLYFVFHVKP